MEIAAARAQQGSLDRAARRFVVLLGFVSLFGDMTYEGARSIIGPYLATLGASATVVGIAAGFGELVGYTVRLLSDYIGDRTGRYWMAPPERRGTAFGLFQTVFGVAWFHWQRPARNYLRPLHACGLCSFTRSPVLQLLALPVLFILMTTRRMQSLKPSPRAAPGRDLDQVHDGSVHMTGDRQ
jgi:hypothetical protein